MKNQLHLLKSKRFLPLFTTQFCGAFNDNVFKNALLIWLTFGIAGQKNFDPKIIVTFSSALFILPFFLFSALAGQIADKYEKSMLVKIIKVTEVIIMICCFIGFYFTNVHLLLFLLFLMGTHSTFFGPLKYSLLPKHLKDNELISGNALIEGGTFLAILLGSIIGGFFINLKNGIEIISFIIVALALIGFISSCFIPKSNPEDANLKIRFNLFSQTWQIINYSKEDKTIWRAIIAISWFWFIGVIFLSQFPLYTKEIINGGEHIITLFFSIFSIGIGIGSVMCNKLLKGKINAKLVPLGSMLITIGILIFITATYFYQISIPTPTNNLFSIAEFLLNIHSYPIILGLLITSVSCGIYIVPLYAIMQHYSNPKYLSRIIAANNVLNALFMVFASLFVVVLLLLNLTLITVFFIVAVINIFVFLLIKKNLQHNH